MRVSLLAWVAVLMVGCAQLPTATSPSGPAAAPDLSPVQRASVGHVNVASVALPNDLWERIRKGFSMPDLDSELVQDRTQWYASRPDYIQRMGERSGKYLYYIVEEIERRGLPTELALLPFVESAFNPQAVSSARAAGMWQFMPATGRDFDLKQNVFRDDRRDIQASTRAALDYLERLYKMFGDWHLALAAYNWGEGNVSKAIARNQRADKPASYADLSMPMETRFYVPKLLAIKRIVSDPRPFSLKLYSIPNHPYFQTVPLPRDMDVAIAAKLAEVSVEDFKALNPAAHRPVLLAAGTPTLVLPWDNAEIFQRNYESSSIGRMASWTAWVAPKNMKVADAAKQHGMSESEFRALNSIPPRMMIKAGSALLVPRNQGVLEDVSSGVADNGRLELAPEVVLRRITLKAGKKDSVASVAAQHQVTPEQVAEWNKTPIHAYFKPGQTVVLYLPGSTNKTAKASGSGKGNHKTASKSGGKKSATASASSSKGPKAGSTKVASAAKSR